MKTNYFGLIVFLSVLLSSCDKEVDTLINVQLNPSIMTLSDGGNEPMKVKSLVSTSDDPVLCYAIQIYENDVPYYYGLFNDVSKMTIALTTNKNYTFKVAAYKTGTGKGLKSMTEAGVVNYFLPNEVPLNNVFVKGNLLKDIDLLSSIVTNGQQKDYSEVDAFYATKQTIIEKGSSNIDFNLLRMGFGINFTVDGLTSGGMDIYMGNDTLKLSSNTTTVSTIRQFTKSIKLNDIYNNADTYGDSISISAKWTGTNGTVIIANGKYKFLRNYQKTINIQINTITNNISFENWNTIPTEGLIAWYPFNGNANDESGNGNNGTVYGATLSVDRFGIPNKAYSFNGASNYIIINKTLGNFGTSDFTVSAWIKRDSNTSGIVFSKRNELGWGNFCSFFAGPKISTELDNQSSSDYLQIISNSSVLTNEYQNIIFLKEKNYFKIYMGGKLDKTTTLTTMFNFNNTATSSIGARYAGSNLTEYFKGTIDDVGIWNRALTQEEITALYNVK